MSTVNVNNFQEFYDAVQTFDNTIVCPEGAVWDMNEIDPLNGIRRIYVNSDVIGNGTTIKNFHGEYIEISGNLTIDQLHMENFYLVSDKSFKTSSNGNIYAYITKSKISCQLGVNVEIFLANIITTQCAINVSFQKSGENTIRWSYSDSPAFGRYNRIKANCPNATSLNNAWWYISDSEIIIDAPLAARMYTPYLFNCTVRGDLQSLTSSAVSSAASNFNVITGVSDSFPAYAESGRLVKITDAQMRDAAYLQSIGFQIGSDT